MRSASNIFKREEDLRGIAKTFVGQTVCIISIPSGIRMGTMTVTGVKAGFTREERPELELPYDVMYVLEDKPGCIFVHSGIAVQP